MSNFEKIYNRSIKGAYAKAHEHASVQLKPLLKNFYEEMIHRPLNIFSLKQRMVELLTFLTTPEGRTNANCWTVDLFIVINDDWEREWSDIPEFLYDIVFDMGGQLHDTFNSPEIAKKFESLPEQLLERAKNLKGAK